MHSALLESAGTGSGRQEHVEEQVAAFRTAWTDHFLPRYFTDNVFRAVEYAEIPTFHFVEESGSTVVARLAVPFAALLLLTLALLGVAANRARQPDVL